MRHVLVGLQHNIIHSLWVQIKETNQGFHFLDLHTAESVRFKLMRIFSAMHACVGLADCFPDVHLVTGN